MSILVAKMWHNGKTKENDIIELDAKNIGQVCPLYLTSLSMIQELHALYNRYYCNGTESLFHGFDLPFWPKLYFISQQHGYLVPYFMFLVYWSSNPPKFILSNKRISIYC